MAENKNGKIALVTGVTGQDGSYLAEILLDKGYEVHGIIRRASTNNTQRIAHLISEDENSASNKLILHFGDLSDASAISRLIYEVQPDEIYNLGAQSHVRVSFDIPEYTADVTGLGTLRILEAIRNFEKSEGKKIKFYQASSSEMFGAAPAPQNEQTQFQPRSPYGVAKVFSFYITKNYRESYGIFGVNGILFNHESPRRGETFVTKKITRGIARILAGLDKKIYLGNLDARRDWGYAKEYMEAAWMMMQKENPGDYVIGTGQSHSVKDFVQAAFKCAGIDNWEDYIGIDPRYFRPAEVENLIADASKAEKELGWKAETKFDDLVKMMVKHDLEAHGLNDAAKKIEI